MALFEGVWREREAAMQSFPGFQGFKLTNDGDQWVAQQTWATIPEWEAWSLSDPARRTHLPLVSGRRGTEDEGRLAEVGGRLQL